MITEKAPSAAAGIESAFVNRMVKIPALANPDDVEVSWSYVNHWDFPMAVERFEESCSCLHGINDASVIEPGKSGTIRATFNAGQYRGVVRKSLHVRFIGHEKPVELVAEAFVPASVVLSSHELTWESEAQPASQIIEVTAGAIADFRITDLRGLAPNSFKIEQATVVEGRHYRLTVTPQSISAGAYCLQIHTDSADPRDRVLAVFLNQGALSAQGLLEQEKTSTQLQPSTTHP